MVKFIGGPSISAYKNYNNHRIARPGQFRMPRNYGTMRTRTTVVVNNSHCHCNQPSKFMQFMYAMPMITDLLGGLLDLFKPKTPIKNDDNIFAKPITTTTTFKPQTTTVVAEGEDVEDVEDVEVVEVVEDVAGDDTPITPTATGELTYTTITTPGTPDEELTVAVNVPKGKRNNGTTTYHGWQTLHASYKGPNNETIPFSDRAFRNWFRETYLKKDGITADIWKEGEIQNFPKSFTYNGKIYTFDENIFSTPLDTTVGDGTVQTGSMEKRTNPGTQATTTTTYKGSVTIAGKKYSSNGKANADDVKNDLKRQLLTDKNNGTITEPQYNAGIAQVNSLTPSQEQASS